MTREDTIKELELQIGRLRFIISGTAEPEVGCPDLLRCCEAMELSVSTLRAQQDQEKNEPLTLEELREMDGEPVWCVFDPDADGEQLTMWALVEVDFESDGDVYLTNNLGGRSGYRTDRGFAEDGITIYRRKPAGGDGQ